MAPWRELPYEIRDVSPEEDKIIKKCLIGYTKKFIKCGKTGYVMPAAFKKHAEYIYNFKVRPDDIWVVTYPRSGTTWTQEMVWLLENGLDFEASKKSPLYERFPMLELTSQIPKVAFELIKINFMNLANFQGLNKAVKRPSWKDIDEAPSPRLIKTHLPLSLLPPDLLKARVIYVARDPRDVVVSNYYLHKMITKSLMKGSFIQFWEAFRRDLLPGMPIISHTNEAWKQRHHPNLHFLFYEDMLQDLPMSIRGVSEFLQRSVTEEQVKKLAEHLTFKNLKKNKNVNNSTDSDIQFIRKGESGGWKTHFDAKMELQAEEFMIERLKGQSLKYPTYVVDDECSRL
ncbi:unnamed protein product [Pieris macdunnoughi]|uniref:Sulfotransferase domain-containing protein n=1 Tax=Pieris macdunnoughi TaxID=345717 RepID=A0A821RPF6_9NEOP|nr:unnamed protein product [Pieris macdunnoughi]